MKEKTALQFNFLESFLMSVSSYAPDLIYIRHIGQNLYHYTDLNALLNIISKDDLWLTHSRYSNDDEEMNHGYRIVEEVIEEERKKVVDSPSKKLLDDLSALMKKPNPSDVYICCFCLKADLLSQWRAYGANGTGVSVKFDPSGFDYITGSDSPNAGLMRLWQVFYDRETQKNIVRQAIQFRGFGVPVDQLATYILDAIQFFIPTFKNADFREEEECRLIFTPKPDCTVKPNYRTSRGMLTPYYSLAELRKESGSPKKLPVKEVRIGPGPAKKLNTESVKMLLAQNDYSGVDVTCSNTPYRG